MMTLVASLRFFVVSAESPVSKLWRASDYDRVTESHQHSTLDGVTACVGHAETSLCPDIDVPRRRTSRRRIYCSKRWYAVMGTRWDAFELYLAH
jgi:hypothetical protein